MSQNYSVCRQDNGVIIGSAPLWIDESQAGRLVGLVTRHLGAEHGALFAMPVPVSGQETDWMTPLSGMPQSFESLTPEEQKTIGTLAAQRLANVQSLSSHLAEVEPEATDLAKPLARACHYVDERCLYAIDGQPVLTFWGHGTNQAEAFLASPMLPVAAILPWYRHVPKWLWWVLGILAMLLLLWLLWWLLWPKDKIVEPVVTPPVISERPVNPSTPTLDPPVNPAVSQKMIPSGEYPSFPLQPLLPPPTSGVTSQRPVVKDPVIPSVVGPLPAADPATLEGRAALVRQDHLTRQVAQLEAQLQLALELCQAEPVLADPIPVEPTAVEPVPEPLPVPDPQPELATLPPPPSPSEPVAQQEPCPPPREPWEAPEVVMVFDISGTMGLPVDVSPRTSDALRSRAQSGDVQAIKELTRMMNNAGSGLRYIDHAKKAVNDMITNLPKDVDTGLILFGQCNGTLNNNFYSAEQRGAMIAVVNAVQPQDGTPLARAVERAGNMINGTIKGSVIVVISDGYDSCGGDACAVAEAIAQAKPSVRINVVDIGGTGAGDCMADATGGKVMTVDNMDDIERVVAQAAGQTAPAQCTK